MIYEYCNRIVKMQRVVDSSLRLCPNSQIKFKTCNNITSEVIDREAIRYLGPKCNPSQKSLHRLPKNCVCSFRVHHVLEENKKEPIIIIRFCNK